MSLKNKTMTRTFQKIVSGVLILCPTFVFASGLDLTLHYGTRQVGLGGQQIAVVDGPYAPFYNPAGLNVIETSAFALNSSTLITQYEAPIGGNNLQRKGDINLGPLFYLGGGYRLHEYFTFGLGFYPTALQGGKFSPVDYSANINGRELSNRLVRLELAPAVAIKITDELHFGASFRAGYTKFDSKSGVFTAAFADSALDNYDARGIKVGLLLNDYKGLSAALTYRAEQDITLKGDTSLLLETGGTPTEVNYKSSLDITIPSQLQVGVAYQWIPGKLMSALSYEFTQNSKIRSLDIVDPTGVVATASYPVNYRDGHTFHIGTEYRFDLAGDKEIATQIGLGIDRAVTRRSNPSPVLAPSDVYLGYAAAAQYHVGGHVAGLALNYGAYDSNSTAVDPALAGQAFEGKYALKSFFIVADYQYHF